MYEYNLTGKEKFRWLQLVHTIPKLWVEALNKDLELSINLAIYDHNLTKTDSLYTQDKLARRSYTIFHFVLCTKNLYHKATMKNYLKQQVWTGENMHFTKKSFYRYKSSYVSVQNIE